MPRPRHRETLDEAAEALGRIAPLANRWVERLLATHEPPLTPGQYLALRAVADGDVVGADLARRAAVSPAAVSQLLLGLEDSGLIERLRAQGDRRRHALVLTPRGAKLLDSLRALLRDRLGQLLAELPPREVESLARALERIEPLLGGTAPPPRRPRPPHPRRR